MNHVSKKITISAKDPPLSVMKNLRYSPIDVTDKASKNPFVIEVKEHLSSKINDSAGKLRRQLGNSNKDLQEKFFGWKNRADTFVDLRSGEYVEILKKKLQQEWGVEQVTENDIEELKITNAKEVTQHWNKLQLSGEENFQLMHQLYNSIYKTDRNGQVVDALPVHIDRWVDEDTGKWQMKRIDNMKLGQSAIETSNSLRRDIETQLNLFYKN